MRHLFKQQDSEIGFGLKPHQQRQVSNSLICVNMPILSIKRLLNTCTKQLFKCFLLTYAYFLKCVLLLIERQVKVRILKLQPKIRLRCLSFEI